jgi:hypothetical protein
MVIVTVGFFSLSMSRFVCVSQIFAPGSMIMAMTAAGGDCRFVFHELKLVVS